MEFNWQTVLNDKEIIEIYSKIDKINSFPFNHGYQHIKNVCNIMDELCNIFDIPKEEGETLMIAAVLHDIGQINGRENHGLKSKIYIEKNMSDKLKDIPFYDEMLDAILNHSNDLDNPNLPMFTKLLQLADKMDFTYKRLEPNYRDKFDYCIYEDILDVKFIYDNEAFGINIITKETDNFYETFLKDSFSRKILKVIISTATKIDKIPVIYVNGIKEDIGRM